LKRSKTKDAEEESRLQLNFYPTQEEVEILEQAVERYRKRHMNAKTRSSIAYDVFRLYLPFWLEMMERRDALLDEDLGKVPAAQQNVPARREGRG
jgi:hypothetical protein